MNKTDYALESFKNIQDLIKFADQKAGAVLVVVGLVFGAFAQYLEKLTFSIDSISLVGALTFFTGGATVVCIITVLYLSIFKILKPRFAKNYNEGEISTFYFEHISKVGKDLNKRYENINDAEMLKDLIDQQVEVSNILNEKNKNLAKSFVWLFYSVLILIVFIGLTTQL